MSVQRFDSYGYMPSPEGKNMRYADHARIVAGVEARWVEIARQDRMAAHQRGAQEAERQHAKALADMEQAHAAALAAAVAAARAEVVTVELVGDYATGYNAGLIEGDAKGRREGKRLAEAAAAPRTLTADEPDVPVNSVAVFISRPSGCPGIVRKYPDGSWNERPWSFFVQDGKRPVAVITAEPIHDEAVTR